MKPSSFISPKSYVILSSAPPRHVKVGQVSVFQTSDTSHQRQWFILQSCKSIVKEKMFYKNTSLLSWCILISFYSIFQKWWYRPTKLISQVTSGSQPSLKNVGVGPCYHHRSKQKSDSRLPFWVLIHHIQFKLFFMWIPMEFSPTLYPINRSTTVN